MSHNTRNEKQKASQEAGKAEKKMRGKEEKMQKRKENQRGLLL